MLPKSTERDVLLLKQSYRISAVNEGPCMSCADSSLNCRWQLTQAQTGKFNVHVHVEYEWCLHNEDLDESDDEMEDKVQSAAFNNAHISYIMM